jgi:serine/tyrosine/threonine adenylyltransferase
MMQFQQSYISLPEIFYTKALPSAAIDPKLIVYNQELAKDLGLTILDDELTDLLSGRAVLINSQPIAQAYAGHQFGHFTKLGDGRAILLGELFNRHNKLFDIQLKGAGTTEYSRNGDGKLALSSALREYIYSECMHALGISTTRSLGIVTTGVPIYRKVAEPGAVLTRIAASHIRVGTFEYAARLATPKDLLALFNYNIDRHFPSLKSIVDMKTRAGRFLQNVIEQQMDLVVSWMRVGFIHGVMNTDNVSIAGETIDYGPCAFMNEYNPKTVYSEIDQQGRYAFGQQAAIAHWNMVRFAEALLPLLHEEQEQAIKIATQILDESNVYFEMSYIMMMHAKVGIEITSNKLLPFVNNLLQWMYENKADYTNTFLHLMEKDLPKDEIYLSEDWKIIKQNWLSLLVDNNTTKEAALMLMNKNNPNYIPRNLNVDNLINSYINTANWQPIENFLAQMKYLYHSEIEDYRLCDYVKEAGYYTHCNT